MQLQAACDMDMKQRVSDSGVYEQLNTVDLFLAKMKELSVISVHVAVHLRNLWKMEARYCILFPALSNGICAVVKIFIHLDIVGIMEILVKHTIWFNHG